jgi:outer membrane receptor protein involved in Fe transport
MKIAKAVVGYLSAIALAAALLASRASAQQGTTTTTSTDTSTTTAAPTTSQVTTTTTSSATTTTTTSGGNETPLKLDTYVVTGTSTPVTELAASFDVSIVPQVEIVTTPAVGVAGLIDSVPGFYGEASGGENGQNLSVDGLRNSGGFFASISLQEDGLPLQYNGFYVEYQLQPDASYGSVEAVTAGPSTVFVPEGGAATLNWITRMPAVDSGDATFSVTSEGSKRVDFFYGGPLPFSNGWSGSIGGFYENGQGPRPVGYTMERGGQIRAMIEKKFDGGFVSIAYKYININTPYYFPEPAAEDSGGNLHSLPGFDLKYDTTYGVDRQYGTLVPPTGYGTTELDGLDLIGAYDLTNQVTVKFEKDFGDGWSVTNGFRVAKIKWIDSDDRHGGNTDLFSAAAYTAAAEPVLAQYALGLAGAPVVKSTELVQATGAAAGLVISNPGGLNGNGLLWYSDQFRYHEDQDNVIDDLRLAWKTDSNKLTLGYMYLDNDITNDGAINNAVLADVRNHSHLYDVAGLNAAGQVVDHLTLQGVVAFDDGGGAPVPGFTGTPAAGFYAEGSIDTVSSNFYLDDEYQITKQFHVDAGMRFEEIVWNNQVTGGNQWIFGAPLPLASMYPNVIAAQSAGVWAAPNAFTANSSSAGDYAWSVGANYQFNDHFSAFARESRSYDPGVQDFAVYGGSTPANNSGFAILHYSQVGAKFESSQFGADVTGYYAVADNNPQTETLVNLPGQPSQNFNLSYVSYGVNFDVAYQPIRSFRIEASGELGHSTITGLSGTTASGDANGNQNTRIPDITFRIKPTYYFGNGRVFISANYYGQRYGDLANTQKLGTYTNLQAGLSFDITKWMTIDLEGDNLTNALAFTEGNPHNLSDLNAGTTGLVYARAIEGTNAKASLTIRF